MLNMIYSAQHASAGAHYMNRITQEEFSHVAEKFVSTELVSQVRHAGASDTFASGSEDMSIPQSAAQVQVSQEGSATSRTQQVASYAFLSLDGHR